jgi:hypothetical protein
MLEIFMQYHDSPFYAFDDNFIGQKKLIRIGSDLTGWRIFYNDKKSNWIVFYPFSESHGGGQPYIINIEDIDFEDWIIRNLNFEEDIRKQIEKKKNGV